MCSLRLRCQVDVVASVPTEAVSAAARTIFPSSSRSSSGGGSAPRGAEAAALAKALRVPRLLRLLRMVTEPSVSSCPQPLFATAAERFFRVANHSLVGLCVHVSACLFFVRRGLCAWCGLGRCAVASPTSFTTQPTPIHSRFFILGPSRRHATVSFLMYYLMAALR